MMNLTQDDAMWLSEEDVKHSLSAIPNLPSISDHGLFGPDSQFWRVNRHAAVYFLGAIPAVMMQLAHPWVASAIAQHSKIMTDPRQRARMTYFFLWSLIYGDQALVARRSQALHRLHSKVTGDVEVAAPHVLGSHYEANEAHAMLWVHVTAFYCRAKLYEAIIEPMSTADKDLFTQEAVRYAMCFGIPEAMHPKTWAEVEAYVADVQNSAIPTYSDAGYRISQFLKNTLPKPVRESLWAVVCSLVPERTISELRMGQWDAPTQRRAQRTYRLLKMVEGVLPASLRYVPAYQEALDRLNQKRSGWLTRKISKAIIGHEQLVNVRKA